MPFKFELQLIIMFVQFVTSNPAVSIGDGEYEIASSSTASDLSSFIIALAGVAGDFWFKLNDIGEIFDSTLQAFMKKHELSVETTITINYNCVVDVVGLKKTNNGRCGKDLCGAYIQPGETVVFEEADILFKGELRPSVAIRLLHIDDTSCRIGFVRSSECGDIDMCRRILCGREAKVGKIYKGRMYYKNHGAAQLYVI